MDEALACTQSASVQDNPAPGEYLGFYRDGVVTLSARVNWPDGTPVTVRVAEVPRDEGDSFGRVIVAGFGLAGRWVADIFDRHKIEYVIVEQNPETVATQRQLGRRVVQGPIDSEETLRAAGIDAASMLVLTIPDEAAVITATRAARRMKPGIYIVAGTHHASAGLEAMACGADEVVKAEQVVARQFYEMLLRKVGLRPEVDTARTAAAGSAAGNAGGNGDGERSA